MSDALLVSLGATRVGVLSRRQDERIDFRFLPEYLAHPGRPVLGQWFLDDPGKPVSSRMRLPPWFSNLLPEGALRALIAEELDVSAQREFDLLVRLGDDLPGAVRVTPAPADLALDEVPDLVPMEVPRSPLDHLKFSLAGVQLKFSMLLEGKRFTLPARGSDGDWIVKLPDTRFPGVPRNEFAMMTLAREAGIQVPEVTLVATSELDGLPGLPPGLEPEAFAIRRYDRTSGGRVHQEDMAQVLAEYPERKYKAANYETIANVLFRTTGERGLEEFVDRLVFTIAIGNGDAHLKNWSLVYPDGRRPRLSPAYDLVATVLYLEKDELGLNLARSKAWEDVRRASFRRLAAKIGADPEIVLGSVELALAKFELAWAEQATHLPLSADERRRLDAHRARVPLFSASDRGA